MQPPSPSIARTLLSLFHCHVVALALLFGGFTVLDHIASRPCAAADPGCD